MKNYFKPAFCEIITSFEDVIMGSAEVKHYGRDFAGDLPFDFSQTFKQE